MKRFANGVTASPVLDAMAIQIALVSILFWLAIVISLPGTFNSPAFSAFAQTGTPAHWSALLIGCGAIGAVGIVMSRVAYVQSIAIVVLATMHAEIAWSLFLGAEPDYLIPPGAGTYSVIASLGYYLMLRRLFGP